MNYYECPKLDRNSPRCHGQLLETRNPASDLMRSSRWWPWGGEIPVEMEMVMIWDVVACWVLWVWHGLQLPRHCGSEGWSSPAPLNGKASHQVMKRLAVEHMYWMSTAKALRCLLSSTLRRHFACATMAGPTISQLCRCLPYAIPSQRDWEYKKHYVKGGTSFYRKNTSK